VKHGRELDRTEARHEKDMADLNAKLDKIAEGSGKKEGPSMAEAMMKATSDMTTALLKMNAESSDSKLTAVTEMVKSNNEAQKQISAIQSKATEQTTAMLQGMLQSKSDSDIEKQKMNIDLIKFGANLQAGNNPEGGDALSTGNPWADAILNVGKFVGEKIGDLRGTAREPLEPAPELLQLEAPALAPQPQTRPAMHVPRPQAQPAPLAVEVPPAEPELDPASRIMIPLLDGLADESELDLVESPWAASAWKMMPVQIRVDVAKATSVEGVLELVKPFLEQDEQLRDRFVNIVMSPKKQRWLFGTIKALRSNIIEDIQNSQQPQVEEVPEEPVEVVNPEVEGPVGPEAPAAMEEF